MITVVDRANGFVVQKVSKPNGETVRYQVCLEQHIGDSSQVLAYMSLAEARATLGKGKGGKPLSRKEQAEQAFKELTA